MNKVKSEGILFLFFFYHISTKSGMYIYELKNIKCIGFSIMYIL